MTKKTIKIVGDLMRELVKTKKDLAFYKDWYDREQIGKGIIPDTYEARSGNLTYTWTGSQMTYFPFMQFTGSYINVSGAGNGLISAGNQMVWYDMSNTSSTLSGLATNNYSQTLGNCSLSNDNGYSLADTDVINYINAYPEV